MRTTTWYFNDEDGINPFGIPSKFEFELTYNYSPAIKADLWGDYPDPGSPAEIDIIRVKCTYVNDKIIINFTIINDWFRKYIYSNPIELENIYQQIMNEIEESKYA